MNGILVEVVKLELSQEYVWYQIDCDGVPESDGRKRCDVTLDLVDTTQQFTIDCDSLARLLDKPVVSFRPTIGDRYTLGLFVNPDKFQIETQATEAKPSMQVVPKSPILLLCASFGALRPGQRATFYAILCGPPEPEDITVTLTGSGCQPDGSVVIPAGRPCYWFDVVPASVPFSVQGAAAGRKVIGDGIASFDPEPAPAAPGEAGGPSEQVGAAVTLSDETVKKFVDAVLNYPVSLCKFQATPRVR